MLINRDCDLYFSSIIELFFSTCLVLMSIINHEQTHPLIVTLDEKHIILAKHEILVLVNTLEDPGTPIHRNYTK